MPLTPRGLWLPPGQASRTARVNPTHGERAPDGRVYEICPMCSAKASLRENRPDGDTWWTCERCGYRDSDRLGPLN